MAGGGRAVAPIVLFSRRGTAAGKAAKHRRSRPWRAFPPVADLGRHFGGAFYEREARHLIEDEWAVTEDDILERRTKHGLHLTAEERRGFSHWLAGARSGETAAAV